MKNIFQKIQPKITFSPLFCKSLILFFSFINLALSPLRILAQESLIDTVQKAQASVVGIIAENNQIIDTPQAAARDTKTGRVILKYNVKKESFQRSGAGVIVDSTGVIVTNTHTILNSQRIIVTLHDGRSFPAQVLGVVAQYDFSFLRIQPPEPLTAITWSDSDAIKLGEDIVTIGHSEILRETISGGKIIGIGVQNEKTSKRTPQETKLIRVNINVYKGDSGGPIFDRKGQFLGLMVAGEIKANRSSFAIPSNEIKQQCQKYLDAAKF